MYDKEMAIEAAINLVRIVGHERANEADRDIRAHALPNGSFIKNGPADTA